MTLLGKVFHSRFAHHSAGGRSAVRRLALLTTLTATAFLLVAGTAAHASVPIFSYNALPSTTEAGAHPDVEFSFKLGNRQEDPTPCACNDARNVTVHLPAGLIANPHAVPQCTTAEFASEQCPVDSQIGVSDIGVAIFPGESDKDVESFISPVFNLIPPPEEAGLLGFKTLFSTPVFIVASARTDSDYGLNAVVANISHFAPLQSVKQVLWGVPAAPVHDGLRFAPSQPPLHSLFGTVFNSNGEGNGGELCDQNGNRSTEDPATVYQICATQAQPPHPAGADLEGGVGHAISSNSPEAPFTQNPTTCGVSSLESSLNILAYDEGETNASATYPATTNCSALAFNPSLFARPTTESTDSPSGIDVDLKAPEFESPTSPSPSEIRGTTVTLPPGFTINPNAADGKTSCTEAQAKFHTTEEAHCPEFAKIGTVEVHSPVLPGTLPGAIYIGQPEPGNRYRLFISFDGFALHVKLPGSVHPDPQTGQLVTEFKELPQFPFEDFDLHFFGSERGILATPTQCGTYPVSTVFEPWDGALPNQTSTQFFNLDSGPNGTPCPNGPRPFAPTLKAASSANTAGSHTSFSLQLTRSDGDQNLSALNVTTPPGFSATLKGVPYCPEADIAAARAPGYSGLAEQTHPSCPAASLVGEAIAGAGAGTHPYYAPGKVYLAGPYKGAPLSFVVITPAVSGPYDLGDVVLRTALEINPATAQVTAVSDPLPQILEGVPLRLRSVLVNLNRPNFALNPTNCEPFATTATAFGSEGATASLSAPFQVANCANLGFKPSLKLSLSGQTRRAGHPGVKAVLTYPKQGAYANIAKAQVGLPGSEFLDQGNLNKVCTQPELKAGACPAKSVYGHAKAWSPLLENPLEGPIYLAVGFGYKLPALVAELEGQIRVLLVGKVDTDKQKGIRNTFEAVPDAPVSRFELTLKGGKKYGLLENSEDICQKPQRAEALFIGQNGKSESFSPLVGNGCGGKRRHKRAANKNGRGHR
jgi:hypothetical protein